MSADCRNHSIGGVCAHRVMAGNGTSTAFGLRPTPAFAVREPAAGGHQRHRVAQSHEAWRLQGLWIGRRGYRLTPPGHRKGKRHFHRTSSMS